MKNAIALLLIAACSLSASAQNDPNLGIIPAPVSVSKGKGEFKLTPETMILVDSPNHKAVYFLSNYLKRAGYANSIIDLSKVDKKQQSSLKNTITLSTAVKDLPREGYQLESSENKVVIKGRGAGLFYGVQTLIQMMDEKSKGYATIPAASIKDEPRFPYRGLHLDVARHFFDVDFVKKYLDAMAAYKLNTFHWHLTDDQGWRIEIKKYPKLTEIGSKRAQTKIGKAQYRDPATGKVMIKDSLYDSTPYSGFYTQDQIQEIVNYASERFITIVPEIDVPGHSMAAIASYPELSCDPTKPYKVAETWGVFPDEVICPTPENFKMLNDIFAEVMSLFPGKYIHLGGDEVPKTVWNASDYCRQLIADSSLRDASGLQSYFVRKIARYINSQGRAVIGWDEILEGGLPPSATVMSWQTEAGGIAAAQLGHDVVMTPSSAGLYFDHAQSKNPLEPLSIGGNAPLSKVYNYDPIPAALTSEQAKHIIGVQGNVWTEYIATPAKVEYMLFPRMLALSEIGWTPKANKDYKNFSEERVARHLLRLDAAGYNYRVPEPIGASDTTIIGDQFQIVLKPSVAGARVYYTLDGYTPRETDLEYKEPLTFTIPVDKQIDFKAVTITKSGKYSVPPIIKMKNSTAK